MLKMWLRKIMPVCLIICLATGAVGGCAAPEEEFEPVVLALSDMGSPDRFVGYGLQWFADEVEKRTDGKVKIEIYWNQSLLKAKETLEGVGMGVADLGFVVPAYTPGKSPLLEASLLPCVTDNAYVWGAALDDYTSLEPIMEEAAGLNLKYLYTVPTGPTELISREPVRNLADLKGLKLRATGHKAKTMETLGAIPTSVPAPEIATLLQRGTIDGALFPFSAASRYGILDECKYQTTLGLGFDAAFVVINLDVWNSLPSSIRKTIEGIAAEATEACADFNVEDNVKWEKTGKEELGVQFYVLSPAEMALLQETAAKPVWENWANGLEDKGLPARESLDALLKAVEKYEKKYAGK